MRKISILSVALFLSATISFTSNAEIVREDFTLQSISNSQKLQLNHADHRGMPFSNFKVAGVSQPITDVIFDVDGIKKLYAREASFYYNNWDNNPPQYFENNRGYSVVAFGEDNDVYFFEILMAFGLGTYTKGTLEGNTITVPLPQTTEYDPINDIGSNVVVLKRTEIEGSETYVYDPTINSVTYSFNPENGSLSLNLPGERGEYALGVIRTDSEEWLGNADLSQEYTLLCSEQNQWPENLKADPYFLMMDSYSYAVEVGIHNDKMYLRGLSEDMPEGVLIADIKDNKAYIPQGQFIGIWADFYILVSRVGEDDPDSEIEGWIKPVDEDQPFVLEIDKENGIIKCADPYLYLCFNNSISMIYALTILQDFTLTKVDSFAGVPANPYYLAYTEDYYPFLGFYSFQFNIPNVTRENKPLLTTDLYYRIYIDGEMMEFEVDNENGIYQGLEEWTTEIPFIFSNNNDIYNYGGTSREVGIYIDGVTTLGVQSVYHYDGITTESDIVTLDIETGEVTIIPGAGVSIINEENLIGTEYYNVEGVKVNNPQKGIFIKKSIFSDGTYKTSKIIVK